jgi:uncharacterized protein YxjI
MQLYSLFKNPYIYYMHQTDLLQANYYPIVFKFKISTFHNDFIATDALGRTHAYVKQKMFKLKEHVNVFADESQAEKLCEIHADKWLDFNTCYSFNDPNGSISGKLLRKGWRSLWKASYDILDENNNPDLKIREANPWAKVLDSVLSEIPVIAIFTGLVANPRYVITRPDGTLVCTFKKTPSMFGRKFQLLKENEFEPGEENRIIYALMMMALLERRRG